MTSSYLIFLDGEKHSIWNNKADVLHQVDILKSHYDNQYILVEELPNAKNSMVLISSKGTCLFPHFEDYYFNQFNKGE